MGKAIEDKLEGSEEKEDDSIIQSEPQKPVKPEIRDTALYAIYTFAALVSLLGLFFLRRKREE